MDRLKELLREPALIVEGLTQLVFLFVAFSPGLVSGDQQIYLIAAIVAVGGLIKAFLTKPFAVTAVTDLIRAGLVLVASLGVGVSPDQIAVVVATVGLFVTAVVRGQISPRLEPAGVTNEGGYAILGAIGVGLIILSVILLVTTLLKVYVVAWVVLIVFVVVGIVLLLVDNGGASILRR